MGQKSQKSDIKWIRLQDICLDLVDRKKVVHIHGSTDVPANLRAAVTQEGGRVDILMNLLYNKNREDVIDSLAHEMAHIVFEDEGHGPEFNKKWEELRESITREYRRLGYLAKAKRLAEFHLSGCVDKADKPKFGHAKRVADRCTRTIDRTVAYLHDLLEDTKYSEEQLKDDFPAKIATAVIAMTRTNKSEDYLAYIRRLAMNPLARRIKLKDLADNLDPKRPMKNKAEQEELRARYREARAYLQAFKHSTQ